ncbi:uncharacterized protein LOC127250567 [Andrographis paniculata]|uniref:uncharacterized protein LOC127250567 n=1 Tax=Andrographis paniculata TaxID=175694 RepID=UPI0021E8BF1D|nr:uncharacterized protein LOC127250567 [Andrographis paniculata]
MDKSLFSLTILFLTSLTHSQSRKPDVEFARTLDLFVADYTFSSYNNTSFKTGELQRIDLPGNLSTVHVDAMRLRCRNLKRSGVRIKEFYLNSGVTVSPCKKRAILVRQDLGAKWSPMYFDSYRFSGYQLVSRVLGIFAYDAIDEKNRTVPSRLDIRAGIRPIKIDFRDAILLNSSSGIIPLCVLFQEDGRVSFSNQSGPNTCTATSHGHFGLAAAAEAPFRGKARNWQIVTASTVGGALGASLLSLLVIAMFVKAKKKARIDELERRAYEEEALQVSMVGHVRAVVASATRTKPRMEIDHDCRK